MDENKETTALCRSAQAGDRTAASRLLLLTHGKVYAYLRRLCPTESDAEDLTQRVFCKVWSSLDSYEGRSSFSTWVHKISYRVFIDWCRRECREEPRCENWWNTLEVEAPSPFDNAADRDIADLLYAAVDTLDHEARHLIHLHYYQGLSLKETAEVLEIATSTVKYRLRAAMRTLRSRTKHMKLEGTYGGKND